MRRLISALGLAAIVAGVWRFRSRLCRLFGCATEVISIDMPMANDSIYSPVTVSGWGRATQHNMLSVEVRDAANAVIGSGSASVSAALGQPGPFTATVSYTWAAPGTPGVVQVYDSSPATGAVTHLASVLIRFS
jgi:hypothetical protein